MGTQKKRKRWFTRTILVLEILSEEELQDGMSLKDIDYEITEGHCSGQFISTKVTTVGGKAMAKLLMKQGSDPEFFGLTEDGKEFEEE